MTNTTMTENAQSIARQLKSWRREYGAASASSGVEGRRRVDAKYRHKIGEALEHMNVTWNAIDDEFAKWEARDEDGAADLRIDISDVMLSGPAPVDLTIKASRWMAMELEEHPDLTPHNLARRCATAMGHPAWVAEEAHWIHQRSQEAVRRHHALARNLDVMRNVIDRCDRIAAGETAPTVYGA